MLQLADDLDAALGREVMEIYVRGFPDVVNPNYLPVLTELAEHVIESPENQTMAVKMLVRGCCVDSAINLVSTIRRNHRTVTNQQAKRAFWELFGVSEHPGGGLQRRGDLAGPLLGYDNGYEGLRKALRRKGDKDVHLTELIQAGLVGHLRALAIEQNFRYTAKYAPSASLWSKEYESLPLYLDLLTSLHLHAADPNVQALAAYLEELPAEPVHQRPQRLSPIAEQIAAEIPELPPEYLPVLSEASAHFFADMLVIYETTFNPDTFYSFEWFAHVTHPEGGRIDWCSEVADIPSTPYCIRLNKMMQDDVNQSEWMLLWVTAHYEGSSYYQTGIAELLGLYIPFRGLPKLIRDDHASKNLGFENGTDLRVSALPLKILYDFADSLTRLMVELQLPSNIPPKEFQFLAHPHPPSFPD